MAEDARDGPVDAPEPGPESAKDPPGTAAAEDWPVRFKYLLADFENYRRRSEREREAARQTVRAEVLREILPLYETFERALDAARTLERENSLRKGLELLGREWSSFWKSEGVEPVARTGERFRSEEHEAVGETAASGEIAAGGIAEVVQQGYRSPSGLLRPAKVVVARASEPERSTRKIPDDAYPETLQE